MKASLKINEVSVELGSKELEFIACALPDHEENTKIFYELSKSPSTEIRAIIAGKRHIDIESAMILLQDDSVSVLCEIIKNDIGVSCMTKEDLVRFVELGSIRLLKAIIIELDEIVNEFCVCSAEFIVDLLAQCRDPTIRYDLARCDFIPRDYLEILADDPDISVAREAERTKDLC